MKRICVLCKKEIEDKGLKYCPECRKIAFKAKKNEICLICGGKIDDDGRKYCSKCRKTGNRCKQEAYMAARRKEVMKAKERKRGGVLTIREVNRIAYEAGSNYGVVSHILNEKKLNRKPYDEALKGVRSVLK